MESKCLPRGRASAICYTMIRPDSRLREFLDIVVAAAGLTAAIEVPLRMSFDYDLTRPLFLMEMGLTLIFGLDILANFRTSIKEGNHLISDRREVARRYLRGWFIVDLLAFFPFFLFGSGTVLTVNRALKTLELLELNRLLKLTRLVGRIGGLQKRHAIHPGIFRLGFFVFGVTIVAHWIACGWILIGGKEPDTSQSAFVHYIDAFYWAVTTLTTVGYGDITPHSLIPKIYTMFVMVTGVGCYGYVIGTFASFLSNLDLVRANQIKKLDEVNAFLRHRAVPPAMRREVNDYYEHLWESPLGSRESRVLHELPVSLRTEISLHLYHGLLRKVPLLREASDDFLRAIVLLLRPMVYPPQEIIIREGDRGDSMYFIDSGTVEVISRDGSAVYASLKEGDFFGEMALVLDQPRNATVRARGYCDLYVLFKRDFDHVLADYPSFQAHVKKITAERLKEVQKRSPAKKTIDRPRRKSNRPGSENK